RIEDVRRDVPEAGFEIVPEGIQFGLHRGDLLIREEWRDRTRNFLGGRPESAMSLRHGSSGERLPDRRGHIGEVEREKTRQLAPEYLDGIEVFGRKLESFLPFNFSDV